MEEKDRHDVVVVLVAILCKDETDRAKDLRVFIVILCCIAIPNRTNMIQAQYGTMTTSLSIMYVVREEHD